MKYIIPTEALNREQNSQEKAYEHEACAGLPGHQMTVGSFGINVVAAARPAGSTENLYVCWCGC